MRYSKYLICSSPTLADSLYNKLSNYGAKIEQIGKKIYFEDEESFNYAHYHYVMKAGFKGHITIEESLIKRKKLIEILLKGNRN